MIGNESAGQKYALYKFVWNNKLGCVEIWIRRTSSFLGGGVKKDRYLVTWWGSIQANVTKQVPKMSQVGYHLRDNWDVTSSDKDVISSEENSIRNNNCSYQISVQSYLLPIQFSYSWWWVFIDGSRSTRHAQGLRDHHHHDIKSHKIDFRDHCYLRHTKMGRTWSTVSHHELSYRLSGVLSY